MPSVSSLLSTETVSRFGELGVDVSETQDAAADFTAAEATAVVCFSSVHAGASVWFSSIPPADVEKEGVISGVKKFCRSTFVIGFLIGRLPVVFLWGECRTHSHPVVGRIICHTLH